jgi:hypothetical protein
MLATFRRKVHLLTRVVQLTFVLNRERQETIFSVRRSQATAPFRHDSATRLRRSRIEREETESHAEP